MKLHRTILLALPVLLLTSCGGEDPQKPVGPSSTSNSQTSGSSTSANPYVRHLTIEEIQETFKTASEGIKKITKSVIEDVYTKSDFNGETGKFDTKELKLTEDSTLYTNSIIFTSFTASNPEKSEEYEQFGKYDTAHEPSYGANIEKYIAFNDEWDKINTIDVYKPIGQANKKNVVTPTDATASAAETMFNMLDFRFDLINPVAKKDKLTTFAVDTKGYYIVVCTEKVETTVGDDKTVTTVEKGYKFQSGQLFQGSFKTTIEQSVVSTEQVTHKYVTSYTAEFSYSANGTFDRSKLPGAN